MLGRLHETDPDSGPDEQQGKPDQGRANDPEANVDTEEGGHPEGEHPHISVKVGNVPAPDAREGRSEIVAGVEQENELDRFIVTAIDFEKLRTAKNQERGGRIPELERADANEEAPETSPEHRAHLDSQGTTFSNTKPGGRANRDDDRNDGEQARDDREEDRRPNPDEPNEREREQRPADRSKIVHGPLEPVRPTVGACRNDIGQERVPGGNAQTTRCPATGPKQRDLPDGRRKPDRCGEDGSGRVSCDRCISAPVGVVCKWATGKSRYAGKAVGKTFDQP